MITAKMTGDKEIERELRRLARRAPNAVAHAVFDEAVVIFNDSQDQVPVDTGRLRASGRVSARTDMLGFEVYVSYNTQYALRIHEDTSLDARRQSRAERAASGGSVRGATVGSSKYLQRPFEENIPGLRQRVAARARAMIESRANMPPVESRRVRGKKR